MIVAQKPTRPLAAPHRPLAVAVRIPRKQQNIALPLVIPLGMEMVDIVAERPPQGALAEEDYLGQALLLDRPHPAFRIGIQVRTGAGSASGSTRPDTMMARNDRVNFVSRSCRRYRQSRSTPQSSMVTFRAICFIHRSSG